MSYGSPLKTNKRQAPADRARPPRAIYLRRQHWINREALGPGRVTVRFDVAQVLMESERNAAQEEAHTFNRRRT